MLMVKLSQTPRATCTSDGNNLFRGSRMLLLKTSPIWRLSKTMASGSCLVVKETSCGSGSKSDTEIFSCCLLDSLTGVASAIALAKKPRATMNFIIFIIMSCRGFGQGFVWAALYARVAISLGQDGHFLFCVRSLWDSRFNDVRTCGDLCLNMIKSFRARRRRGSADKSLVC